MKNNLWLFFDLTDLDVIEEFIKDYIDWSLDNDEDANFVGLLELVEAAKQKRTERILKGLKENERKKQ